MCGKISHQTRLFSQKQEVITGLTLPHKAEENKLTTMTKLLQPQPELESLPSTPRGDEDSVHVLRRTYDAQRPAET